jgi:hypothetical protein
MLVAVVSASLFLLVVMLGDVLVVAGVMRLVGARFVLLGIGKVMILPWRGVDRRVAHNWQFWWSHIWVDRPSSRTRALALYLSQPVFILLASAGSAAALVAGGHDDAAVGVLVAGLFSLVQGTRFRRRMVRSTFSHLSMRAILRGRRSVGPISRTSLPVLRRAYALQAVGQDRDGYRVLADGVKENPHDIGLRVICASAASNCGLFDEAEIDFRHVLDASPATAQESIAAANGLAYLLVEATPAGVGCDHPQLQEALRLAEIAIQSEPGNPSLMQTYAAALCRTGRFDEALSVASQLAHDIPADNSGDVGVVLAWALAGRGRSEEAISTWLATHADRSSLADIAEHAVLAETSINTE